MFCGSPPAPKAFFPEPQSSPSPSGKSLKTPCPRRRTAPQPKQAPRLASRASRRSRVRESEIPHRKNRARHRDVPAAQQPGVKHRQSRPAAHLLNPQPPRGKRLRQPPPKPGSIRFGSPRPLLRPPLPTSLRHRRPNHRHSRRRTLQMCPPTRTPASDYRSPPHSPASPIPPGIEWMRVQPSGS